MEDLGKLRIETKKDNIIDLLNHLINSIKMSDEIDSTNFFVTHDPNGNFDINVKIQYKKVEFNG